MVSGNTVPPYCYCGNPNAGTLYSYSTCNSTGCSVGPNPNCSYPAFAYYDGVHSPLPTYAGCNCPASPFSYPSGNPPYNGGYNDANTYGTPVAPRYGSTGYIYGSSGSGIAYYSGLLVPVGGLYVIGPYTYNYNDGNDNINYANGLLTSGSYSSYVGGGGIIAGYPPSYSPYYSVYNYTSCSDFGNHAVNLPASYNTSNVTAAINCCNYCCGSLSD